MANTKISQLTAGGTVQGTDLIPIDRSGTNFSVTALNIVQQTGAAAQFTSATLVDTAPNTDLSMSNSTAATSSTPQSSPLASFGGTWWGFTSPTNATPVSNTDVWTVQTVPGTTKLNANISNIVETSGLVTLTISSGTFIQATIVTLSGLTTAPWLNGLNLFLLTANATTLTFIDPTNHADVGSTSETGSVAQSTSVFTYNHTGSSQGVVRYLNCNLGVTNNTVATATTKNVGQGISITSFYWTGAASAADIWNFQTFLGSGTNAASGLFIDHAGSSGAITVGLQNTAVLAWGFSSTTIVGDTGLSRDSAGIIDVGNGTQGDKSGSINLTNLTATGTVRSNAAFNANGTVGVSAGSFTAITAITTVGGIVTQLTGSSDARLKHYIPYEGGLNEVVAITPFRYAWNKKGQEHTGLSGDKEYVGFVAQNVQESIPEAITGTELSKDGKAEYLCFDDRPIVAALVNAVKELTLRIKELEDKLENKR